MAYYNRAPRSTRDNFIAPLSPLDRILSILPFRTSLAIQMQRFWERSTHTILTTPPSQIPKAVRQAIGRNWSIHRVFSLPHLFVAVWVVVLLWGERWVFEKSIQVCRWENWERWPKDATPHHLVFIADPQLIDPHSYPDRPWPASTFTIWHTDNYMKRSYIQLSKVLHPDTLFFLGDLFDGGREWKTVHGNFGDQNWAKSLRPSQEQKWVETWGKRYGEDFWLHEYARFGNIFSNFWNLGGSEANPGQRGRRFISGLPGNHDLGFGAQIKIPVRNRFETYFGEMNRVDVIANHTFVSVDSVSLSAGSSDRPMSETVEITAPVEEFLAGVGATKRRAIARELSYQAGKELYLKYDHKVEELSNTDFFNRPTLDPGPGSPDLPTILLTHVPLYRDPGTPCGPQRERWPPAAPPKGQTSPVNPDERNAISISKGYQYQNVLSNSDSVRLVSSIGNVVSVFSGDDHDYCEIVHPPDKNNAREITVKSTNWAQGVRKPGFLMLSMWNPIGPDGQPLNNIHTGHGSSSSSSSSTMQSHLCLLPDQIGILIRYGVFVAITLLALIVRSILTPLLNLTPFSSTLPSPENDAPLLPTSKRDQDVESTQIHHSSSSSTSSSNTPNTINPNLAPRSSAARTRSVSPAQNGYSLPATSSTSSRTPPPKFEIPFSYKEKEDVGRAGKEDYEYSMSTSPNRKRKDTIVKTVVKEAGWSIWRVLWVVSGVYLYLIWYG